MFYYFVLTYYSEAIMRQKKHTKKDLGVFRVGVNTSNHVFQFSLTNKKYIKDRYVHLKESEKKLDFLSDFFWILFSSFYYSYVHQKKIWIFF